MLAVEKVSNGYIITRSNGAKEIYPTIEEVFRTLLLIFEGKNEHFDGKFYGKITITTKGDQQ
jgi:hypothetical protein